MTFPLWRQFDMDDHLTLYMPGYYRNVYPFIWLSKIKNDGGLPLRDYGLWIWIAAAGGLLLVSGYIILFLRHERINERNIRLDAEIRIAQSKQTNSELRQKIETLYNTRLTTLNNLCNEYFNKKDAESAAVRLSIYREIEKSIESFKSPTACEQLANEVNSYLDNILIRLKASIPGLTSRDIAFATYIYAGFSPKAICLFTDIKLKNFYNRRDRLKKKIQSSGTRDADFFIQMM